MADDEVEESELLEQLIQKLIRFNKPPRGKKPEPLEEPEVWYVIDRVIIELRKSSAFLEIESPVTVCGDTHGQYEDVIHLFNHGGWPPGMRYLFLGDYVDRGDNSIETVSLMFLFKLRYPSDFFILRGNHECHDVNRIYGFYDECKRRYSVRLWKRFNHAFRCLPIAALVSNRIFCMHGGLSPHLVTFDQLRRLTVPLIVPDDGGLVADLLWSDPEVGTKGYVPSNRGISYKFGEDVVVSFCKKHNIDLICRGHQVVTNGFEFFAARKLITVFSAPNYCGEFDNSAGMLYMDEQLNCKLRQFKSERKDKSQRSRSR